MMKSFKPRDGKLGVFPLASGRFVGVFGTDDGGILEMTEMEDEEESAALEAIHGLVGLALDLEGLQHGG